MCEWREPGRVLDAYIATEVMGEIIQGQNFAHYSTDWGAVGRVIDYLTPSTKTNFTLDLSSNEASATFAVSGAGWWDYEVTQVGETGPHAICLAALLYCRAGHAHLPSEALQRFHLT